MSTLKVLTELAKHLHPAMIKVADETSLYPDIPTHYELRGDGIKDAREALATLVALDFATPSTRNYHKIEHIRKHIARMATNYNCEGQWKNIQDYLKNIKPFVLYEVVQYLLTIMNENDIYGNFMQLVKQKIRSIKVVKTYNSVYLDNRPVVRAIRKRGYNDKGSISPLHTRGRYQPMPEKAKRIAKILEPKSYQWYDTKKKLKYDEVFDFSTIPEDKGEKGSV